MEFSRYTAFHKLSFTSLLAVDILLMIRYIILPFGASVLEDGVNSSLGAYFGVYLALSLMNILGCFVVLYKMWVIEKGVFYTDLIIIIPGLLVLILVWMSPVLFLLFVFALTRPGL